ncbi:MAG: NUDIX domain-containing protein [Muribaculaceae bacterium]|nr:NUDIX domain-containing protein [Muribaculaceae bacterium]
MTKIELLPIVDEQGNILGSAPRSECHARRLLHPVVHLHLVDAQGNILLQKRSETKLIQPGKWDTSVGGHVDFGELISVALRREASEEIGLDVVDAVPIACYVWDCPAERELVYTHISRAPRGYTPRLEKGEADDLQFWSIKSIEPRLADAVFTPNFVYEFTHFLKPYLGDK